ncbi:hypothetical protein GN956_G20419 [Arapaima gigas]
MATRKYVQQPDQPDHTAHTVKLGTRTKQGGKPCSDSPCSSPQRAAFYPRGAQTPLVASEQHRGVKNATQDTQPATRVNKSQLRYTEQMMRGLVFCMNRSRSPSLFFNIPSLGRAQRRLNITLAERVCTGTATLACRNAQDFSSACCLNKKAVKPERTRL